MQPHFAARYGSLETWHWWFRARERIFGAVLDGELPRGRPRVLVTVGCGPASGLAWLRPWSGPGGRLIGVDADPVHAQRAPAGTEFVIGQVESIPLATATADALLAFDVLEHVVDDAAALRETWRVLRPGGLLLVSVPALPGLWGPQDTVNHHLRRYTRATLTAAFARAGLPAPQVTYFNTVLFPIVAAVRWARRLFGREDPGRTDFDDNRPGLVNEALLHVFASERHLITRGLPLPIGVSLLATVRAA